MKKYSRDLSYPNPEVPRVQRTSNSKISKIDGQNIVRRILRIVLIFLTVRTSKSKQLIWIEQPKVRTQNIELSEHFFYVEKAEHFFDGPYWQLFSKCPSNSGLKRLKSKLFLDSFNGFIIWV